MTASKPSLASSPAPTARPPRARAFPLLFAIAAGLCWSGALALLFSRSMPPTLPILAPLRLLFYLLVVGAALCTFVPVQRALGLPALAREGTAGCGLLFYTLAFVPPPNDWLFALPDMPVYMLLMVAVFWSSSALVQPFVYVLRQHIVRQRGQRLNPATARRHAHEVGIIAAGVVVLAGLRVLTWISLLLLVLIVMTTELLWLSRGKAG